MRFDHYLMKQKRPVCFGTLPLAFVASSWYVGCVVYSFQQTIQYRRDYTPGKRRRPKVDGKYINNSGAGAVGASGG